MAEGLLGQYRKKLEKAIGTARFYGLPERQLEKVFVELTVIEDFEIPRDAEYKALMDKELRRRRTLFPKDETEEDEEDNPEETDEEGRERPRKIRRTVKPEELLEAGKRSQVVGAPGCGKTTLLRWLALQTAKTSNRLPIFIELKALKKAQFDTIDEDFSVFLFQQGVRKRFDRTDLTTEQFTALETVFCEYYKAGRLVVLLDGLDEIAESERHRLRAAVENYASHHEGGLTLIVSTRPYGYLRNFADLKAMEIEPLSDIQIEQFLNHWCEKPTAETVKANLRKNPNLRSLGRFPFLLAFIAHLNSDENFPRIGLYQKIVAELIDKLDKDKGKVTQTFRIDDPKGALKRIFLRQLSFERLFESQTTDLNQRLVFSFEELVEQAEAFLRKKNRNLLPEDLAVDVCATPLLREVENERYTFAHLTIQEFLAAEELSKRDDCQKLFIQAFFNRQLAEMEVLPMTIGLADDSNRLYDLLSKLSESFDFVRLRLNIRSLGYHQRPVQDAYHLSLQGRFMDFVLGRIQSESVYSRVILNFFKGVENYFLQELTANLLLIFANQDHKVRQRAAEALGILGVTTQNIIDALLVALGDEESGVRYYASEALGKLGSNSPEIIDALFNILSKPEHDSVRQSAGVAVAKLGLNSPNIIAALLRTFRNQSSFTRQKVTTALLSSGSISPEIIDVLVQALGDQDAVVRQSAADLLGKLGSPSMNVITGLLNSINDPDDGVRSTIVFSLGSLGSPSPKVIDSLLKTLKNDDFVIVRKNAAHALGTIGSATPEVVSGLLDALEDQTGFLHSGAIQALGELGSTSQEIITALNRSLNDPSYFISLEAATTLITLGITSPKITNVFVEAMDDQNLPLCLRTIGLLGTLQLVSPVLTELLIEATKNPTLLVRQYAVQALAQLGLSSPNLSNALVSALGDQDSGIRRNAAEALGKLGVAVPETITALSKVLEDQDWNVRLNVAEAIRRLGATSPQVIVTLVKGINHQDWYVPVNVVTILERIGFDSLVFCEGLKLLLSDPDPELQKMALRSIGYPSTDPELLDDLKKLTESENPEIRQAAKDAHEKYKFKLEMLELLPA